MTETGRGVGRPEGSFSPGVGAASNYTNWVLSLLPEAKGAVLEVGLGAGNYFEALGSPVRYLGVDNDSGVIDHVRCLEPKRDVILADVLSDDFSREVRERLGGADTIICCNVLEHIEDDGSALRELISVLRPGGHALIFVPAFRWLWNDLDDLAGHLRRYTMSDLESLSSIDGVSRVRSGYVNPIGAVGWWVNRFRKIESLDAAAVAAQIRIFDRFGVPLSRLLTHLTSRFFGQSVHIVLRRDK